MSDAIMYDGHTEELKAGYTDANYEDMPSSDFVDILDAFRVACILPDSKGYVRGDGWKTKFNLCYGIERMFFVLCKKVKGKNEEIAALQEENERLKKELLSTIPLNDSVRQTVAYIELKGKFEMLREKNEKMRKLLKEREFTYYTGNPNELYLCNVCGGSEKQGHAPGCELAAALEDE